MAHEHNHEEELHVQHITVIDENGNEQLCEVIHVHESPEFGKSYVFYSMVGAEEDEDGSVKSLYLHLYHLKMVKMVN